MADNPRGLTRHMQTLQLFAIAGRASRPRLSGHDPPRGFRLHAMPPRVLVVSLSFRTPCTFCQEIEQKARGQDLPVAGRGLSSVVLVWPLCVSLFPVDDGRGGGGAGTIRTKYIPSSRNSGSRQNFQLLSPCHFTLSIYAIFYVPNE